MQIDDGFQEAVAIVADASASAARLCAALGYRIRHAGRVPEAALALLGLDGGDGAAETLIGHPDSARGDIRLIAPNAPPAALRRDGGQAWDSGGIFDINIRVLAGGIAPLHRALGVAGFRAHAPVTAWDFGGLSVREVVESDADGLCIALMQRMAPPLEGYDGIGGPASWVFNATQIVADFDAARALYVDVLGWRTVQETEGVVAPAPGLNCMGFPPALAADITMRIGIYQARGRMAGSVEIIAFGGGGHDFSMAAPAQRGWAALRFPVGDVGDFARRLDAAGCAVTAPTMVDWAPHGIFRAVSAVTPWGVRLEAFERSEGLHQA